MKRSSPSVKPAPAALASSSSVQAALHRPGKHTHHQLCPDALIDCLKTGSVRAAGRLLCNVLEPVAARLHPELLAIREDLCACGACGAQMTGSGSAVFGLFPGENEARSACEALKHREYAVFYARSV